MLLLQARMLLDGANNAYLAAGTLFEMAVCKVNSDGTSAWTQTVAGSGHADAIVLGDNDNSVFVVGGVTARISQGAPPPPPPTNLMAKFNSNKRKVNLAWTDNATTETGYTVQRCTGSGCTDFVSIALLPPDYEKHQDGSISKHTSYRYRVYAESDTGPSDFSNIAEVLVP